jgi:hypothetical protein
MKNFRIVVLIVLVAIAAPFLLHRRAWALRQSGQGAAAQSVQPSALKITSPQANEKIAQTFVAVQYQQLAPASAASTPTYELRLDSRDPVQTTDTSYTFNGLTPGAHDLIVQIVDANGVPISGTRSEVKFTVVAPVATGSGAGSASNLPPLPTSFAPDLPAGNSSLPLLSIIGFGILVGGVISALRTRPAHK